MLKVYKVTPDIEEFAQGMYFTTQEDAEKIIEFLESIMAPGMKVKWTKEVIEVMAMPDCIKIIAQWAAGALVQYKINKN